MEITGKTKLFEVLATYPQLEDQIIQAAPAFKNLKNPILRRTVGRLATVEKVAEIGELDVFTFINLLRRNVGQTELVPTVQVELSPALLGKKAAEEMPDWIQGEPEFTVNGSELLANGAVPLHAINECLQKLSPGRYVLLLTDFEPKPMIEAVQRQKRKVYHIQDPNDPAQHKTYFQ